MDDASDFLGGGRRWVGFSMRPVEAQGWVVPAWRHR
jgi:hypothetical protein